MVHPDTRIRFVSEAIGYGVFATRDIPMGTLMYARDPLEIEISPEKYETLDRNLREIVEKFSYMDRHGVRVLSWDHGKRANHSCDCNTMATAYDCEIAIRDIAQGEEITCEYGLFNVEEEMILHCGCECCRGTLRPDDWDSYAANWDASISAALARGGSVDQPLLHYVPKEARTRLQALWRGQGEYESVLNLRCRHGGCSC